MADTEDVVTDDVTDETTDTTGDEAADKSADQAGSTDDAWDPERAKAAMSKKNRENETLRRRLKELEARDAQLKEIEDSKKTAEERLTERSTSAESKVSNMALENNRLRLRLDLGLTEDQAARVSGADYEDMKADAEALLALFNKSADTPAAPAKKPQPKASELKGGLNPGSDDSFDAEALAEKIHKRSNVF